jgi:hypothetical protein
MKGYNIDIEFWGTQYMELPSLFKGIQIQMYEGDIPDNLQKFKVDIDNKIFQLSTGNSLHYIIAAGCRVGKNSWISENRILDPTLDYEETIAIL